MFLGVIVVLPSLTSTTSLFDYWLHPLVSKTLTASTFAFEVFQ